MSLGLRTATPIVFSLGRELTPADMDALRDRPAVKPEPLKAIRARHHAIARALALGQKPGIVAATYGFSNSRISILMADPTFAELVEHYRAADTDDLRDLRERLIGISIDAADEISRRLETAPEALATDSLLKMLELTADRTGHGPKSSTDVNFNVGFADRLRAARERTKMIDVTPLAAE